MTQSHFKPYCICEFQTIANFDTRNRPNSLRRTLSLLSCHVLFSDILHICPGHHGQCSWRKSLPCGEICPHDILSLGEILHRTDGHVEKVLHIRNVKKICYVEKQIYGVLMHIVLFCCKLVNFAIYAVLSQNLFCRNLRIFVWRKN